MKNKKTRIIIVVIAVIIVAAAILSWILISKPVKIDVLIIPKFEVGELTGDSPGEAQLYYEEYCAGGKAYELKNKNGNKLYVKDGVGLYLSGMGKVNAASSLTEVLEDRRFDLTDAYIISTGCGGGAAGNNVPGDVVIGTAVVDFDLGHHADPRELEDPSRSKWFRDPDYDYSAVKILDPSLTEKIFDCAKDVKLSTTDATMKIMRAEYKDAEWASREPMVMKGTILTSDNYWKGEYDHQDAIYICNEYNCPDPYAVSEMEDIALAVAADKYDMLDHYIVLRVVVDEDVFIRGATPESIWDKDNQKSLTSNESKESFDIFETAMHNNFDVGKRIIEMLRHA